MRVLEKLKEMRADSWLFFATIIVLVIAPIIASNSSASRHHAYIFTLARLFGTASFAWIAYTAGNGATMGIAVLLALVFNPVFPVHFAREAWAFLDVFGAIFILWFARDRIAGAFSRVKHAKRQRFARSYIVKIPPELREVASLRKRAIGISIAIILATMFHVRVMDIVASKIYHNGQRHTEYTRYYNPETGIILEDRGEKMVPVVVYNPKRNYILLLKYKKGKGLYWAIFSDIKGLRKELGGISDHPYEVFPVDVRVRQPSIIHERNIILETMKSDYGAILTIIWGAIGVTLILTIYKWSRVVMKRGTIASVLTAVLYMIVPIVGWFIASVYIAVKTGRVLREAKETMSA